MAHLPSRSTARLLQCHPGGFVRVQRCALACTGAHDVLNDAPSPTPNSVRWSAPNGQSSLAPLAPNAAASLIAPNVVALLAPNGTLLLVSDSVLLIAPNATLLLFVALWFVTEGISRR
jgi:hypothetical protein